MEPPKDGSGGSGLGPAFTHIHCSSRYDRPAATLEAAVDEWRKQASVITLTEVNNDRRAATLAEQGWGYFNAKLDNGSDDVAIAWRKEAWKRVSATTLKLSSNTYSKGSRKVYVYSSTVVLKRVDTGLKLRVSVSHFPAHVEGPGGWRTDEAQWQARKLSYLSALKTWSTHIKDQENKTKVDATLIVADWNLNLKLSWVHDLMSSHWGKDYPMAWKHFPTTGGSRATDGSAGPQAPPGAPGKGYGDRIIDGSLYRALKVTNPPELMPMGPSSDHRPFIESFRFLTKGEQPDQSGDAPTGDVSPPTYPEWWGFGDYIDDEIYSVQRVFES